MAKYGDRITISVDEQIKELIEWMKKYPQAVIKNNIPTEILQNYSKTNEEYEQIVKEYKAMQKYYKNIKSRYYHKILMPDQLSKCKEGNIRGVFGYPTHTEKIAQKYKLPLDKIDYIISHYDTMEQFYELYRTGKLNNKDMQLAQSIIKSEFDIDFGSDDLYKKLFQSIIKGKKDNKLYLYSSEEFKKNFNNSGLTSKERATIIARYDTSSPNSKPKTFAKIALERGIARANASELAQNGMKKLSNKLEEYTYSPDSIENNNLFTEEEKELVHNLEHNLFTNGMLSIYNETEKTENEEILKAIALIKNYKNIVEERRDRNDILISELNLTTRLYRCLNSIGISTLGDIKELTKKELMKIKGFGKNCYDELCSVLEKNKIEAKIISKPNYNKTSDIPVSELKLSTRVSNCLEKAGRFTLDDISKLTKKELMGIEGFGQSCYDELCSVLHEYGLSPKMMEEPSKNIIDATRDSKDISISELNLSTRLRRCLNRKRLSTLGDISNLTEEELMKMRNFGKGCLKEVHKILESHGLSLKEIEKPEGTKQTEQTERDDKKTDLERAREKRDELQKIAEEERKRMEKAKELYESYRNLGKEQKNHSKDE